MYLYVRKKADKQNRLHNHLIKAYIFFDLLLAGQLTREELIKEVCIKNPVQVSVYDAAEGNIQKGGLPLLLKEVKTLKPSDALPSRFTKRKINKHPKQLHIIQSHVSCLIAGLR